MTEIIRCSSCGCKKLTSLFGIKSTTGIRYKSCLTCMQKVQCPHCDYEGTKGNLSNHLKYKHNPDDPALHCPHCPHVFVRAGDLKQHILSVHEKSRDHQCPQCESKFSRSGALSTHMQSVHEKIKHHSCDLCDFAFYCVTDLRAHKKAVHDRIRDNECPRCNHKTSESSNLRRHMLLCTGVEKMSSGEYAIKGVLDSMQITFEREMSFVDCRGDTHPLRFDFYLPQHVAAIEFDGKQHFEPVEHWGGQEAFERTQRHDTIKNTYCVANNIRLLRIKYTDFERIQELIETFLVSPVHKHEAAA